MFEIVVIAIVAVVAIVLLIAAAKSPGFRIHRSTMIHAPPEKVFPLVNDFHRWREWSPWESVEGEDLQRTFSGPESGEDAAYAWQGRKTGVGRMKIFRSDPPNQIDIELDFEKPMKAHNTVNFLFLREHDGTLVTWTMQGEHAFMGRLMGMFMNVDKMVGKSFDEGLAKLKAAAER